MKIIKSLFSLLALLLILGACNSKKKVETAKIPERPNVLFIAIDDLNDWVGVLGGHPQAKHPIWIGWPSVVL